MARRETKVVRITKHTLDVLNKIAFGKPFYCSSIADFFVLVERGDLEAIKAWQDAAKEDDK